MDTFGIDMKKYCRNHEESIRMALKEDKCSKELLALHREKIAILQHERLAHLIVIVMVVLVEVFLVNLVLIHPDIGGFIGAVVMLALAVLLGFYFRHYFF
jgi:uncharacterized membrane protein